MCSRWRHAALLLAGLLAVLVPVQSSEAKQAELVQRRKEIEARAPAGFVVLIEPPFIVAGDEPGERVRQWAAGPIRWAVDQLKRNFFLKDPDEVITIWLFKDRSSYETNTRRLFRAEHPSPYGYYSPADQALIMNIATGGGTLIHEIVHPYVRANFPTCPAWFNEGLGSLYEQSEDRAGRIHGLPNWRLPGLQDVVRAGRTIPFEEFVALSDTDFYGGPTGYNQHYGQARYLCYYLQEQGLLIKFYREFLGHHSEDPTGLQTLKKVLGTDDLLEFQRRWEKFLLDLRYP
jgi:hypothetical protein